MQKDFEKWHKLKAAINGRGQSPLFRESEIWWCSVGANVGVEEDGKNDLFERPVLVFHRFNKEMFWGFPMTSQEKHGTHDYAISFRGKSVTVLISQLRLLSSKRLVRCMGRLRKRKFENLIMFMAAFLKTETDPPWDPRVPRTSPKF